MNEAKKSILLVPAIHEIVICGQLIANKEYT